MLTNASLLLVTMETVWMVSMLLVAIVMPGIMESTAKQVI